MQWATSSHTGERGSETKTVCRFRGSHEKLKWKGENTGKIGIGDLQPGVLRLSFHHCVLIALQNHGWNSVPFPTCRILSWNHRTTKVGKDFQDHEVQLAPRTNPCPQCHIHTFAGMVTPLWAACPTQPDLGILLQHLQGEDLSHFAKLKA